MQSIKRTKPGLEAQVIVQTCIDVIVILVIMHASGGVLSGLGMLLIINISMTSLFLQRRMTLLLAAATSLAILLEHTYSLMLIEGYEAAYTQAGLLGVLIFVFAVMTSYVSKRLYETEQLATQQGQKLESVVNLNEHIINNMRTGIMAISSDGKILMANNAAKNLLGNIDIATYSDLNAISPPLQKRLDEWRNNTDNTHQTPVKQSHGLPDLQPGFSPIETGNVRTGDTLIFLEDASQLNQRFQEVKLASLGRLTASIAHEIRNPLAAIHHASQLLEESVDDSSITKLTQIINTQSQRLNGIVENVLTISRRQQGITESINLGHWLKQFKEEFCSSHGLKDSQMSINVTPDSTTILFDSSHLSQVLLNLCNNAIHHSGVELSELEIKLTGGSSDEISQPYIDIIDNGRGIDEVIESEIFEPFFTTNTKGSGLGLYITKEVIENNRARIKHVALPTGGNCFRIFFMKAPEPYTAESNT